MSKCSSCGADIWWVRTEKGKRMPLDAKPEQRVIVDGDGHDEPVGRVVKVWTPHWATCPNAEQHRRPKGGDK